MVKLSSNRLAWTYTSEDGKDYRVAAQKALTDQAKLGGGAWNGSDPPKPAFIKMRRITVKAAGVGSRVVPVYDNAAAILASGATVNANFQDDVHTFTSDGEPIPEQRPRRSVTTQAA